MRRHAGRFGLVGGARWRGVVYQPGGALPAFATGDARIYQGIFGYAGFQRIYGNDDSELGYVFGSVHWLLIAVSLLALGILFSRGLIFFGIWMVLVNLARAWDVAARADLTPGFDGARARWCLFGLVWAQPLVRGWARYMGSLGYAPLPRVMPALGRISFLPRRELWWSPSVVSAFWSEQGVTRDALFEPAAAEMSRAGWSHASGHGWENWDLEFRRPVCPYSLRMSSVTEYHQGENRLTRVRLRAVPTAWAGLVQMILVFAAVGCGVLWGYAALGLAVVAFWLLPVGAVLLAGMHSLRGARHAVERAGTKVGLAIAAKEA